jgi:hypothetical protein
MIFFMLLTKNFNIIEIYQYQNTVIYFNQIPRDLIFSYTYGLGYRYFALIVENINNTIHFINVFLIIIINSIVKGN